jgi:predicted Zn-dependent protease
MKNHLAREGDFRRIVDDILSASQAEDTYVGFNDSEGMTLRFANNQVVQNVSERGPGVSVRAAFGRKVGAASTNRLDRDSLMAALRRAEELARLAPEDPEYMPPLPQQKYLDLDTYSRATASASPDDLAARVKPIIRRCERSDLVGAGILSTTSACRGTANSAGLFGFEESTSAEFSLTATSAASDSSGWTMNSHRHINSLDIRERAENAVDKAVRSANPVELPAGKYPVIFEPAAVAGMLGMMFFSLNAKSYYRGNSPFTGKLNTKILDDRITFRTEPGHPDLLGSRFGGDGMASKKIVWIENGVLKQLFYDRFTAKEHNVEPTPFPSSPILTVAGKPVRSTRELIRGTERAVLVTNFWYIRMVDPRDLTITGMTRDGTFLVENGRIVSGVRNFRFHESPLRAFAQIDAATAPQEAITMERGKMLLPAVRLPEFNFSSVTKF